ncbi:MAG: hypothetical protein ACI4WT_14220 [Oligosphaeraceae bacterium]
MSRDDERKRKQYVAVTAITAPPEDASGKVVAAGQDPGSYERHLLTSVMGLLPRLPYPSREVVKDGGKTVEVYEIPEDAREAVLAELYPFSPAPRLDDTLFDLHEGRNFQVRDFLVVREDESNFAVSPYYLHSGGTILDWIPLDRLEPDADDDDEEESDDAVRSPAGVAIVDELEEPDEEAGKRNEECVAMVDELEEPDEEV